MIMLAGVSSRALLDSLMCLACLPHLCHITISISWGSGALGHLKKSIDSCQLWLNEVISCELLHGKALLQQFLDPSWQNFPGDGFPTQLNTLLLEETLQTGAFHFHFGFRIFLEAGDTKSGHIRLVFYTPHRWKALLGFPIPFVVTLRYSFFL